MFDSSVELTDELAYNVTRGTVDGIVEMEECSINKEKMCSNLLKGLHFLTLHSHFSKITCLLVKGRGYNDLLGFEILNINLFHYA